MLVHNSSQVAPLVRQVADGLSHLHMLEVAHRDLKPANILFHDSARTQLKICDFGFAIRCGQNKLRDRLGTLIYKAPELCSVNARGSGYLGRPVDMWALGAVAYEMLHNRAAFHGNSEQDIEMRISMSGGYNDLRRSLSAAAKGLIQGLLCQEVAKRMTAAHVLAHPWVLRAVARAQRWLEVEEGAKEEEEHEEQDG